MFWNSDKEVRKIIVKNIGKYRKKYRSKTVIHWLANIFDRKGKAIQTKHVEIALFIIRYLEQATIAHNDKCFGKNKKKRQINICPKSTWLIHIHNTKNVFLCTALILCRVVSMYYIWQKVLNKNQRWHVLKICKVIL